MRIGGKLHELELKKTIQKLRNQGFRVVNLQGLSPDAIAVKNGKIIAVEVLGYHWREKPRKEWHAGWTHRGKRRAYSMFDEVLIFTFKYPPAHKGKSETIKERADETVLAIKKMLEGKKLTTTQILEMLPFHLTRRQVNRILEHLRTTGKVVKETVSKGRHGRYCVWSLVCG